MKAYKLTRSDGTTGGGGYPPLKWEPGVTRVIGGKGTELCTGDVIHVYHGLYLAAFMDPIHANYGPSALAWECETPAVVVCDGTKAGVKSLTTVQQVALPMLTTVVRVRAAIVLAQTLLTEPAWDAWAAAAASMAAARAARAAWAVVDGAWAARAAAEAAWAARAAAAASMAAARAARAVVDGAKAAEADGWDAQVFALHIDEVIRQAIADEAELDERSDG